MCLDTYFKNFLLVFATASKRELFSFNLFRSKYIKSSKEHYLLGQKHNLQMFGVIHFIKLQSDT